MKRMRFLLALAAAVALTAPAEEHTEFTEWMKTTDEASKVLRKLEKKTGQEAVAAAEKIGGVYENMIGFWRQRNLEDAVKWSIAGKAAAVQLAAAANAGDADQASTSWNSVGGTCKSCHDRYRERTPDGKFRFKPPQQREPR
jgi:cytochrome c556